MEAVIQGVVIAIFVLLSGVFIRCGEILYDLAEIKDYLKFKGKEKQWILTAFDLRKKPRR